MDQQNHGWTTYERMVLDRLERLDDDVKSLREDVQDIRVEIAMLKVKSGLWGAAAGFVPVAILTLFNVLGSQP